MTKLLHIGLGKCGSTFLQKEIFPRLEKKINTNYINVAKNDFFNIKGYKTCLFENFQNIENLLPNDFIISNESLFSNFWEFSRIEKNFECIKDNFSNDTVILIVIRNPYDLLNSIYCHSILTMNIAKPENFFYIDDKEINIKMNKFNLHNFDYSKLISLYKSYFKKVVVVKYENLQNLDFLKNIFNLDDEYLQNLKKNTTKIHNKSISKFGINFILFLNNFFDVKKNQQFIRKFLKKNPDSIIVKIKNSILGLFLLKNFFQSKFDRIVPYKKYYINRKSIPLDIEKEISKYNKLDF